MLLAATAGRYTACGRAAVKGPVLRMIALWGAVATAHDQAASDAGAEAAEYGIDA